MKQSSKQLVFFTVILCLSAIAAFAQITPVPFSSLSSGGTLSSSTDKLVTVRNGGGAGNPDVLTTVACSSLTNAAASCSTDATNASNISAGALANARLTALSANQVLGALTATTPSGLGVPSCNAAGNALNWTPGSGFGCATGYLTSAVTSLTGDGGIISNSGSTGAVTLTLANQTANTVLGALTVTTPSDLAVPSCSAAGNALKWTSGTGFGCATGYLTSSGAVTSIIVGTGLTGGTITTTGTIAEDALTLATKTAMGTTNFGGLR